MNGLAQITIDGQKVALKFGMPAIRRIMQKMGEQTLMEKDKYTELGLVHVLYAGYLNSCAMRDEVATIPFETFYELVEEGVDAARVEIIEAMKAFEESKFIKDIVSKKKAMTPSHNPSNGTT